MLVSVFKQDGSSHIEERPLPMFKIRGGMVFKVEKDESVACAMYCEGFIHYLKIHPSELTYANALYDALNGTDISEEVFEEIKLLVKHSI